ncbi:hypothetical protein Q0812_04875 [Brevundimonas sp. 2R-24]|uniref:Uncharacterized protein n=1 Tax=Peiella sedimenti TaxID=3061083 RepID=A0ABT8SN92_9CAUL|nr:hypothetical protein [Caulobacteraceae bacterium XZ-24]
MTYIEPTPPGGPSPEIEPGAVPMPEIEPGQAPVDIPPPDPGVANPGDSRPHD